MLITRAGFALSGTPGTWIPAAQRMPAWMSESRPPHLPSTRTGMTLTPPCETLAMPTPLLVAAPMRPSVWVPCHELEPTSLAVQPGTFVTSAVVTKSPGSEASASRPATESALFGSLLIMS